MENLDTKQIVEQTIEKALHENPDIRVVLEIAARAREIEARELPRELGTATDVVAIPNNSQCAL
jgi:hypothetical protein